MPEFAGALVSDKMRVSGLEVAVDDMVFRDDVAGSVKACVLTQACFCAVVEVWSPVAVVAGTTRTYRCAGHAEVWPAAELQQCQAWYHVPDGMVMLRV